MAVPTRTEEAAYVYGVTWASAARAADDGVAGGRVVPLTHRKLAALTTAVPSADVRARRRDLLRHSAVLQDAFGRAAVVPLRFGTVFTRGADVVSEFLAPRHDELASLLRRLEGLAELTVRAFYDEAAVLTRIARENATVTRLRSMRRSPAVDMQLGEAVAHALARQREDDALAIVRELRPRAREIVIEERQAELEVLRAAFLVERSGLASFDRAMNELARRGDGLVNFKYTGPLPPHHFVGERWAS